MLVMYVCNSLHMYECSADKFRSVYEILMQNWRKRHTDMKYLTLFSINQNL